MSGVPCQVSHVKCQVSGVMCHIFVVLSGGASQWRVSYQWGLPRLVSVQILPLRLAGGGSAAESAANYIINNVSRINGAWTDDNIHRFYLRGGITTN